MSIEASQLIANLGGRAAAHKIRCQAPVGTAYVAQYQLSGGRITHYYDSRFRLHQDGHWASVGIQQFTGIKTNSLFTVTCELRDIFNALEVLPTEPNPNSNSSCSKCTSYVDQLAECRSNFTQLTKEFIALNNGQYWWRVAAIGVISVNVLAFAGQWWPL